MSDQRDSYWEERARRFATDGEGLAAVCSYGVPGFCNRMIEFLPAFDSRAMAAGSLGNPGA
jgi:hypothetical protein